MDNFSRFKIGFLEALIQNKFATFRGGYRKDILDILGFFSELCLIMVAQQKKYCAQICRISLILRTGFLKLFVILL
jgi:hypothetical protein